MIANPDPSMTLTWALIEYPSLQQQLAVGLGQALGGPVPKILPWEWLAVEGRSCPGRFMSPVALQWVKVAQRPAVDLAHDCLQYLAAPGLRVWVEPPGWIHGAFGAAAIATHLQSLTETPPHLLSPVLTVSPDPSLDDPDLFPIQYAHARCCSLLQLAAREQMIDLDQTFSMLTLNHKIPWLTADHQWQLHHPAEQALIAQLLQFPGTLVAPKRVWYTGSQGVPHRNPLPWPPPRQRVLDQAQIWSQLLLALDRDCQIFGAQRHQDLDRCQARLGLILATQRVLAFFLQELLQVIAPHTL